MSFNDANPIMAIHTKALIKTSPMKRAQFINTGKNRYKKAMLEQDSLCLKPMLRQSPEALETMFDDLHLIYWKKASTVVQTKCDSDVLFWF